MKKLTHERIIKVKAAIWNAQVTKERIRTEIPPRLMPRWYELMNELWNAEETVMTTLGCSMTRCQALLAGEALLSDYYDMATGKPKAAK